MDKQEKQELIEKCRKDISQIQSWHDADDYLSDIKIYEIALASLTAPPVKLPGISELIETSDGLPNVRDVSLWDEAIKLCAENIRTAGYEVEGQPVEPSDNGLVAYLNKASDVVTTWPEWKKKGADASKFTRPASEQAD